MWARVAQLGRRLQQPRVVAQVLGCRRVRLPEFDRLPSHTVLSLKHRQQALVVQALGVVEMQAHGLGERLVTVGDHMRVEIAHVPNGPVTTYGVGVTVDPGERVELNTGDIVLAVEVDSTWTDILPAASPGLGLSKNKTPALSFATTAAVA